MSHYYLASPAQIQRALDQHCAQWEPQQARIFKTVLWSFLDGQASIEARIRMEAPDPELPRVGVAGEKPGGST